MTPIPAGGRGHDVVEAIAVQVAGAIDPDTQPGARLVAIGTPEGGGAEAIGAPAIERHPAPWVFCGVVAPSSDQNVPEAITVYVPGSSDGVAEVGADLERAIKSADIVAKYGSNDTAF